MPFNQEILVAAKKAYVDTPSPCLSINPNGLNHSIALNCQTELAIPAGRNSQLKALSGASARQERLAPQSSLLQPSIDRSVCYRRSHHEIPCEMQEQSSNVAEDQFGQFQKQTPELIGRFTSGSPAGPDTAIAGMRSFFNATNTVLENPYKVHREFPAIAEVNLAMVSHAMKSAVTPIFMSKKKAD